MIATKKPHASEVLAILNCRRLPARLNTAVTATLLGFQEHDIGPLVSAKLLKPLGKPAPNAPKYFAASEVVQHCDDVEWLTKATVALAKYWQHKNAGKKHSGSDPTC
jgi:hypothetical protein